MPEGRSRRLSQSLWLRRTPRGLDPGGRRLLPAHHSGRSGALQWPSSSLGSHFCVSYGLRRLPPSFGSERQPRPQPALEWRIHRLRRRLRRLRPGTASGCVVRMARPRGRQRSARVAAVWASAALVVVQVAHAVGPGEFEPALRSEERPAEGGNARGMADAACLPEVTGGPRRTRPGHRRSRLRSHRRSGARGCLGWSRPSEPTPGPTRALVAAKAW